VTSTVYPTTSVRPQSHTSKFRGVRVLLGLSTAALLLASCASASASSVGASSMPVSASPSGTRAETPSVAPTPSKPDPSPSPTTAALVIPPVEVGDYLEVTGNGLAVRAGPGSEHALVSEYLITGGDDVVVTRIRDEVRLPAGYVVRAWLGPLVVDDSAWFAVSDVQQAGEAAVTDQYRSWRAVAPVAHTDPSFELTWIAVAQSGTTLVRTTGRPGRECPCYGDALTPNIVAAGVGEGRVGPWKNWAAATIVVAAASPSAADTCEFRLMTQAGESININESAVDYFKRLLPGVYLAPKAATDADVWLDVLGDCAWAVSVQLPQG
jgi:hypothetical protein